VGAHLRDYRWPEITGAPVVLLPVGSTEQHGHHLPLDTDAVVATAVAEGMRSRLGPGVLVAPTVPYGASGEHQHFPGTVSIGSEALGLLLLEFVRSVSSWAAEVIIVNGHGGNASTIASVVRQARTEGHRLSWVPCAVPDSDAHAGLTETSLMLHLAPQRVMLAKATLGNTRPLTELLPALKINGVRSVSPTGVLGDPTGASAEHGKSILQAMIDGATGALQSARRAP
jgi:mycofactocin system creatininase family protein